MVGTLRSDGRWQGSITVNGRRRAVYARTQEALEEKLDAWREAAAQPRKRRPVPPIGTDNLRRPIIARVLAEAEAQGWDRAMLEDVLVAQLAAKRLSRGIFGPCVYCGTWVAGEVEHRHPRVRGGTDDPDNLVSSCRACNADKGVMTDVEYARYR